MNLIDEVWQPKAAIHEKDAKIQALHRRADELEQ